MDLVRTNEVPREVLDHLRHEACLPLVLDAPIQDEEADEHKADQLISDKL